MVNVLLVLVLIALAYNGVMTTLRWAAARKKNNAHGPVNEIPDSVQTLSEEEKNVVNCHLEEWKIIIQTQMHFNDLIIRFRSLILTAFITLIGATLALQKTERIEGNQVIEFLFLVLILWGTAFVLDFFYYHRLLLGSVAQALKFDNSDLAKRLGLFGLTTCISNVVHPPASKVMVILFYGLPALAVGSLMVLVFGSWT